MSKSKMLKGKTSKDKTLKVRYRKCSKKKHIEIVRNHTGCWLWNIYLIYIKKYMYVFTDDKHIKESSETYGYSYESISTQKHRYRTIVGQHIVTNWEEKMIFSFAMDINLLRIFFYMLVTCKKYTCLFNINQINIS